MGISMPYAETSISYLNEHSEFIIKAVNHLNSLQKDNHCIYPYTFDSVLVRLLSLKTKTLI